MFYISSSASKVDERKDRGAFARTLTTESWQAAIDPMKSLGYEPVESNNPYWDKRGKTFQDPDGYRVVFQNTASD